MMIAIFLVTISISPFLSSTIGYFRSELEQLELIEAERIAELSFRDIKLQLYQNMIDWDDIPKNQSDSALRELDTFYTEIPGFDPKPIRRSFLVWGPLKEGNNNKFYKKVHVLLTLEIPGHEKQDPRTKKKDPPSPYQFYFTVFAQKFSDE